MSGKKTFLELFVLRKVAFRYSIQQINLAQVIQEEFTDSLLAIILENKNNDLLVTRGLNLLKMLLSDVENDECIANTYVYVHEALSREFYKIYYDQYKTLRHLRVKCR